MDRESVVKLTRAMKNRLNGIRNKNKEKNNFDLDPSFFSSLPIYFRYCVQSDQQQKTVSKNWQSIKISLKKF